MADYLVIVESPNKIKSISKYLGPDYKVVASFGHIRGIPTKVNMVDKTTYQATYEIDKDKKKVVSELVSAAKGKSIIYLCTDPDREGEGIAWHIMEVLKNKGIKVPFKRVVFHEITKNAVQEAFNHSRDIDMNLVHAQQSRQSLDYLVGFSLSPMLWRNVGKGLSAGRVQSPALKLISSRDNEIKNFNPEEYWSIHLNTHKDNIFFTAKLYTLRGIEGKITITSEKDANRIIERIGKGEVIVTSIKSKEVKRKPKAPFITSSLQQDAFRKLNMSAKKVMNVAQTLFEKGHITYMRTDSTILSKEAISYIQEYIQMTYGKDYLYQEGIRIYDKKSANAQEAHEAIRPTSFKNTPTVLKSNLSDEEYNLYLLIWNRTIASQMSDAVFNTTTVTLEVNDGIFRCSGSVPIFLGFLSVYEESSDDEKEDNQKLPSLVPNEVLPNDKIYGEQHFTQPPPRFNEATLVGKLEELGIGRPSTYSSIIDVLKKRQYVDSKNKRLESTEVGQNVANYLDKHFPLYMSYDFTSNLEESLDGIANGKVSYLGIMQEAVSQLDNLVNQEKKRVGDNRGFTEILNEECPECQSKLGLRKGKYGPFISCTGYPTCQYHRQAHVNKEVEYLDKKCPECQSQLVKRHGKNGEFIACSGYPKCKYVESDKPTTKRIDSGVLCPKCRKHNLFLIEGKYAPFLGCGGFLNKSCKHTEKPTPELLASIRLS